MSGAGAPEPAAHNVSACSLQNVSFSLSPGKVTALVGPSGSGKSSCVNVLENFYPLDGGRVLLDGRPVGAYDHKFLHRVVRGRLRPLLALPCLSFALAGCDRHRRAPQRVATGAAPPRSRGRASSALAVSPEAPPAAAAAPPTFTVTVLSCFSCVSPSPCASPRSRAAFLPRFEPLPGWSGSTCPRPSLASSTRRAS